ncbi:MAG TPA: glycosyltransferase [Cyclobacteriaceae bacterium]|nr:glycosyltransferase [Cyclobacteriaceae bacterium]
MQKVVHIIARQRGKKSKPGLLQLIRDLAMAQFQMGLDVSVWKIGEFEESLSPLDSKTFPSTMNRLRLSKSFMEAIETLPDKTILHLHNGFVPEYYTLSRKLKRSGAPYRLVLSPHGLYSEARLRSLSTFVKAYFYLFEQHLVRNASMLHLIGPAEVSGYTFYLNNVTPFVSIPNGLSRDELQEPSRRDYLNNETFIVTYSGHLNVYEKGLDILLKSFATFSNEVYSQTELWLIGSGADENELKKNVRCLGVDDKVKFYGDLDNHAKKKRMTESHVFVQPSRLDCIPMNALEAASEGIPLIVTEETNLGGFVRQYEAGWFLSRNDVKSLTLALHDAYFIYQTDPDGYNARGRNAYRMIREELNWNSLAHKWMTVYSSVL